MKTFFDTSVLVPALVDQLGNHPVCFSAFLDATTDDNRGVCSTHTPAECYSVMTALPLQRRVTGAEALQIVEHSIMSRLTVVEMDSADYQAAIRAVADANLGSGIVYDALHVVAARKSGCDRILTYNLKHFEALCPPQITVSTP